MAKKTPLEKALDAYVTASISYSMYSIPESRKAKEKARKKVLKIAQQMVEFAYVRAGDAAYTSVFNSTVDFGAFDAPEEALSQIAFDADQKVRFLSSKVKGGLA